MASIGQPLFGQAATGEVNGTITDPSGSGVVNAKVVLRDRETGAENATQSNSSGSYSFVRVRPSQYVLSVEAKGFRHVETSTFTINVSQTLVQDITLTIGQVSETVTVTTEAPQLATASSELGTVINNKAVTELPLNGRNFTQILTLTPGATPVQTAQGAGTGTCSLCDVSIPTSPAFRPSVNGAWNRSNLYYLDGIMNTVNLYSGYAILPVVDAVQEFKVQSHNDKAEYGGAVGGIVNIVSKSGTNDLHGAGWEFLRNNYFDARNPFTDAKSTGPPAFHQNQFGATAGGPVVLPKLYDGHNKTFFQFSWESWRYLRVAQSRYYTPTDAELSGDFSNSIKNQDIYDPATTRQDPNNPNALIRDKFPGRIIPSNRINQAVVQWIKAYLDRPNYTGNPLFNVLNTRSIRDDSDSYQIRMDQRIGNSDSVWYRYSRFNNTNFTPDTMKHGVFVSRPRTNTGGGWNHVFSPTLILDARFGYLRHPYNYDQIFDVPGKQPAIDAGFQNVDRLGVPGIGLGSPWNSPGEYHGRETDSDWQVGSNMSWIRGRHGLRFGFDLFHQKRKSGPNHGATQAFSFNDQQTADPQQLGSTGASLASALLGVPNQVSYQVQNNYFIWPTYGFYAQDEWRATPKLTVNLGLRYDLLKVPSSVHGTITSGFSMITGDYLIGGTSLPPACDIANKAPCIPGNGDLSAIPAGNHIRLADRPTLRKTQTNNWGPRLGIAYQVMPKTVIRAGYGISYDLYAGFIQDFNNTLNWWPDASTSQLSLNNLGTPLVTLDQVLNYGAAALPGPSPWNNAMWTSDPDKKNPFSHQWNFEIQHQMAQNLALSLGYVGSATRDLELSGTANVATTPGPGTPAQVNARKPFPWEGPLFYGTSRGRSDYNSLQAKIEQRYANGLQYLVSYTWSKAVDNGSSGFFGSENGPGGSSSLQDYYHPNSSRGVAAYDVTHFLSVAGTYDLPFGRGRKYLTSGPAAWVLGGWQTNVIAQIRSGQPYNLQVSGDVANVGNTVSWFNYARPNLVGNPYLSKPTYQEAFNTSAFAVPQYSYGNFGKNILRSEHVPSVDFSMFKRFPLSSNEVRYLEFRAETFNILNIIPAGVPGVLLNDPSFGVVSSMVGQPRNLLFGVRVAF